MTYTDEQLSPGHRDGSVRINFIGDNAITLNAIEPIRVAWLTQTKSYRSMFLETGKLWDRRRYHYRIEDTEAIISEGTVETDFNDSSNRFVRVRFDDGILLTFCDDNHPCKPKISELQWL